MTNDHRLEAILVRLAPHRERLLQHPIYDQIDSIKKLHVFMEHHIFAVWDFMSLLKTLQQRICCVDVPWLPPSDAAAVRFVNEIVLAEESDEDSQGGFVSHFDLYHRAMKSCGANTATIDRFLDQLRSGHPVRAALANIQASAAIRDFVTHTFDVIESGQLSAVAAAFLFGREDLLPDVFQRIVDKLNVASGGHLDDFIYYLKRHIELDGGHHGPMAAALIGTLCGDDQAKWQLAADVAVQSLQARHALWDSMANTRPSSAMGAKSACTGQ